MCAVVRLYQSSFDVLPNEPEAPPRLPGFYKRHGCCIHHLIKDDVAAAVAAVAVAAVA